MKLIVNKVGKIKEASLDINGLTVIAGKNDTGKSTIGKVLYSLCRALGMYNYFFDDVEKDKIVANNLIPLFRKYISSRESNLELVNKIVPLLEERGKAPFNSFKINELDFAEILDLLSIMKKHSEFLSIDLKEMLAETLSAINKIQNTDVENKLKRTLNATSQFVFSGDILNSKYHENASVKILVGDREVLSVNFTQKDIDLTMNEVLIKSIFGDVIYVESPFVLDNIEALRKPQWYEIAHKIKVCSAQGWNKASVNEEFLDFIQTKIFGKASIVFNEEINMYRYQVDESSTPLDMSNVACGTKSFSLIFLLLKLNLLTKNILLVLDEPENHLHPEWQIKYAEMVCLLISKGFSIVLASHSPTFIQALSAYSRKYGIQDKTSFYLSEKIENENYSKLIDVTDNLEKISENLIEPMDKLFLGV